MFCNPVVVGQNQDEIVNALRSADMRVSLNSIFQLHLVTVVNRSIQSLIACTILSQRYLNNPLK